MKVILNPDRVGTHGVTTRERFWSKVHIRHENECWIWLGSTYSRYGSFKLPTGLNDGGSNVPAHRYSYFLKTGYYPETNEYVCHTCDNGFCVNPNHLFLGTQTDNMRDMVRKGRNADSRGSKNPRAKLAEADVLEIRRLRKQGKTIAELANAFKTPKSTIDKIVYRDTWKYLADGVS